MLVRVVGHGDTAVNTNANAKSFAHSIFRSIVFCAILSLPNFRNTYICGSMGTPHRTIISLRFLGMRYARIHTYSNFVCVPEISGRRESRARRQWSHLKLRNILSCCMHNIRNARCLLLNRTKTKTIHELWWMNWGVSEQWDNYVKSGNHSRGTKRNKKHCVGDNNKSPWTALVISATQISCALLFWPSTSLFRFFFSMKHKNEYCRHTD